MTNIKTSTEDKRAYLMDMKFDKLNDEQKRDKQAYKMKLYRQKQKETNPKYNENEAERVKNMRAKNKVVDAKIIDKENIAREKDKNLNVLLNSRDRVINKLEKENKKLTDKIIVTDIIGTKPAKGIKANPTITPEKREAKIKIVSNVIENIYGFKIDIQERNVFSNLMNKSPSITKQKIDDTFKKMKFLKSDGITGFVQLFMKKYPDPGTAKQYLTVFQYFLNILHKMPEYGKSYYEDSYYKLNTITKEFNKAYSAKKATGKIDPKRQGLYFDYNHVETTKILNTYKFKSILDKLIYSYYTSQPPRRVSDVYVLEITQQTDLKKLVSKTNNYIILNKQGKFRC